MFSFLDTINNYDERKVNKTTCKNGIIVSTAWTTDCGYETALIDKSGVHPVERYPNKESAILGHTKWMEFAEKRSFGDKIIKLGDSSGWVKEKEIELDI